DRPVEATGPDEIAELARDIEAMRSRIVDDLHAIDSARAELASQGEELTRSNRDLEQFAYVASHDLQEPLRKVASFCQLLRDRYRDQLDERGVQYIDFAVDGAKRMQALVTDLLAFSRVGRTTENFVAVDLNRALIHAEENLEGRMRETGATVVVVTPLPTVRGDATLMAALWQNLIGNAVKFRSDQAPRVEVTWRREDEGWRFWLRDNGIGIEPQYAERVFTIFQRLHGRDRYEGTGIGLALCRKIVEFHGGRISLESEDRPGTTVTFTLPFDDTPEEGPDG
ncbi:MAG: sensor histidine kinase, partial [Acidimicrobiales bacterium]